MDVFLVPVGGDRHELYCEAPVDPLAPANAAATSWWRRYLERFRQLLAEAEEERRRHERGQPVESRGLWRWIMRKIAESIAEQRLLWHLRTLTAARLVHPADVPRDRARELARGSMQRDYEKHRRWFAINALLMVACLPLTVIPGPNLPSLYFTFRTIGHFFSMRGARRGLDVVTWEMEASTELAAIRQALQLMPADRRARVDDLAAALGLDRLGAFVERVAS
jgi:hypothetical protein